MPGRLVHKRGPYVSRFVCSMISAFFFSRTNDRVADDRTDATCGYEYCIGAHLMDDCVDNPDYLLDRRKQSPGQVLEVVVRKVIRPCAGGGTAKQPHASSRRQQQHRSRYHVWWSR